MGYLSGTYSLNAKPSNRVKAIITINTGYERYDMRTNAEAADGLFNGKDGGRQQITLSGDTRLPL